MVLKRITVLVLYLNALLSMQLYAADGEIINGIDPNDRLFKMTQMVSKPADDTIICFKHHGHEPLGWYKNALAGKNYKRLVAVSCDLGAPSQAYIDAAGNVRPSLASGATAGGMRQYVPPDGVVIVPRGTITGADYNGPIVSTRGEALPPAERWACLHPDGTLTLASEADFRELSPAARSKLKFGQPLSTVRAPYPYSPNMTDYRPPPEIPPPPANPCTPPKVAGPAPKPSGGIVPALKKIGKGGLRVARNIAGPAGAIATVSSPPDESNFDYALLHGTQGDAEMLEAVASGIQKGCRGAGAFFEWAFSPPKPTLPSQDF